MKLRNTSILLLAVCVSTTSLAADWPHWRGPDYNGISTETDWDPKSLASPEIVWSAEVGTGFSAISVVNGKAYCAGNINKETDIIYCFDALTGQEKWRYEYAEPLAPKYYEGGCSASPTIHDGKVYTLSKKGAAYCLNADTGDMIWTQALDFKMPTWGFSGSALIIEDLAIYNVGAAGVALNKATGDIIWKSENDVAGYATPVPYQKNGKAYICLFAKNTVMGIEAKTGTVLWSYPWETKYDVNAADPIISGDKVFITSGYGHGAALIDIAGPKPKLVWENKNMRSQMSGPVLIDGFLYGIDDNQLACVDWKSGQQKWTEKTPKKGALCAAGDRLIIMGEKGALQVAAVTPDGYQQIASAQVLKGRCWTMPVLANGKIYVRNAQGHLVCVNAQNNQASPTAAVSTPAADIDWPQWQGPNRDNISTETGLLAQWPEAGPALLWSVDAIGHGYSSPAIADGKIYITGMIENNGWLTCFDTAGTKLWSTDYGLEWKRSFPGTRCTPTISDGNVYLISGTGQAVCLNAQTGDPVWKSDVFGQFEGQYPHWGYSECPLIVNDKLIVTIGGKKALCVALNKKDGSVIWTTPANEDKSAFCSPAAFEWAGKTLIANMTNNHIVGIDTKNGALLFSYPVSNYITEKNHGTHPNVPIFKDGKLFVSSGYDMGSIQLKLSADATSVEKVWTNLEFDNHHGGIVLLDGKLYGANWQSNKQGKWVCVNWETGEMLYEQEWGNKGSLSCADGMLYCYEEASGTVGLVKATPDGFNPVSAFQITQGEKEHWAHPVIFGKRLYIRHGGTLMAFDIAAK
jgi:outer membrane protein assembly factor BamB